MKKHILLIALILSAIALPAQPGHPHHGDKHRTPPKVEEMVSNLSPRQRKSLLETRERSHARVEELNARLNAVRDSIRDYIHRDGDNSKALYPLFDREGVLQSQISKEMYSLRLQIDAILTPGQIKELRAALAQRKKKK